MKKNLLIKTFLAALVMLACNFEANAKWEMLRQQKSPYCMHITANGNILMADYLFDGTGGIYLSEDQGQTWIKTDAPDYTYGKIIDAGEYIIATGRACRVARSNDNGKTWEMTNYRNAVSDIMVPSQLESTICYAATMHKGRLYIGDYAGGGILYSEDFGETWKRTHLESLQYEVEDKSGKKGYATETIYNLVSYKDELYAFGIYFVFRYDEENDVWITLRNDSNFLTQSTFHKDKLIMGRTIMNQSTEVPYLLTFDGENWGELWHPAGTIDTNVRCLASDDNGLFIGMQLSGFYYSYDDGQSWVNGTEGLPESVSGYPGEIQHIIDLEEDDDYVYAVVYDTPFNNSGIDGIYRVAKSELNKSGSNIAIENEATAIYCDGSYLYVGECDAITISDLSGRAINATAINGKVDVQNLTPGVYVYSAVNNDKAATGKFIKK